MADLHQTAVFYGASDDLIELEGIRIAAGYENLIDEYCCFADVATGYGYDYLRKKETKPPFYKATYRIKAATGSLFVHALYDGTWIFAVGLDADGQGDDAGTLPDWPVRVSQIRQDGRRSHSMRLEIDCPLDAVVHPAWTVSRITGEDT